jgi:hypothetical protein
MLAKIGEKRMATGRMAAPLAAAAGLLAGCATVAAGSDYSGRPIAQAVEQLGAPHEVADHAGGGRYFTWSTSDVVITEYGAENPAHWLTRHTRADASAAQVGEAQFEALPPLITRPPFKPKTCALTLVAQWSQAQRAWIARRAIRGHAPAGGHCGIR